MAKQNTILIVDDGKENIDALRGILEDKYNIRIALNGEAALRTLQNIKPDLMLLDVMMPKLNGFEVLEIMSANPEWASIPVIFITADTDFYSESKGLSMGAVDYVMKPYDPTIVSIKVRNAINNKMYRDSLERLVEMRTAEVLQTQEAIIIGMSLLAERRDHTTGEHIRRIKLYSELISGELLQSHPEMITREEARYTAIMSPLHDIGKVGVPDAILLKPGKLSAEEFEQMKMHSVFGADVLRKTKDIIKTDPKSLQAAVDIAESHHEKYDGSGYPYGLHGDEIPLPARIVALADIYDALTTWRPYKRAFTHAEAADIILNGDGRTMPEHFDPRVLTAFKALDSEFARVVDDNGEC